MLPKLHELTFPGDMNRRGFWLYVWRIESPIGELLYVGRTGDSSSLNAASPIKRMGQHLDAKAKGNMLYRHLRCKGIDPETCAKFQLFAYGPLAPEEESRCNHRRQRDKAAALEKRLADALGTCYHVMNKVNCKKQLDEQLWSQVHEAFSSHFPLLAQTK